MKIGVSSYSFSKYIDKTGCDYFTVCDKAKEIGFDGIEFINLNKKCAVDDEIKTAKEIKAYCEKIGLEIVAYTVGANLLAGDLDAEIANLKHCVDVAEALGVKTMRHDIAYALPEGKTWWEVIDDLVPSIREITNYAKAKGIRTCSENHGYIFQAPERVKAVIDAVADANYGWLIDIGNFLCADCQPLPSVKTALPYAMHVHAKDFLYKDGSFPKPSGFNLTTTGGNYLRGTVVGHGVVPVKDCLNAIKASGYDGWISLEFEGAEENIYALTEGLNNIKAFLA